MFADVRDEFPVWRYTGYITLLYLAGPKGVDSLLREAVAMGGSGEVSTFFRIIQPVMGPINLIVLVVGVIESLREGGAVTETVVALPKELYEAADVDGASILRQYWQTAWIYIESFWASGLTLGSTKG